MSQCGTIMRLSIRPQMSRSFVMQIYVDVGIFVFRMHKISNIPVENSDADKQY